MAWSCFQKYHSPRDYELLFNKMKKSEKAKLATHCAKVSDMGTTDE